MRRANALRALEATASMYKLGSAASAEAVTAQFTQLLETLNAAVLEGCTKRDYGDVFARYVQA